jgi:hypothetical protein
VKEQNRTGRERKYNPRVPYGALKPSIIIANADYKDRSRSFMLCFEFRQSTAR